MGIRPIISRRFINTNRLSATSSGLRRQFVESKIEFEHVDPWFAETSQFPPVGVLLDQVSQGRLGDAPLTSYARDLKLRGRRRDFRIKSRGGCGEQIHGNQLSRVLIDANSSRLR